MPSCRRKSVTFVRPCLNLVSPVMLALALAVSCVKYRKTSRPTMSSLNPWSVPLRSFGRCIGSGLQLYHRSRMRPVSCLAHSCRSRAKAVPAPALAGSTANFPCSPNPAIISEIAQLSAAGHVSLAWLVERLHADALLLPLAHAAASIDTWWTLGETLAYGKLEIQGRVRDGLVVDPAVKWIVVRMLARGRYVRYCDVRRAGDWDLLKASLRRTCQLPSWW